MPYHLCAKFNYKINYNYIINCNLIKTLNKIFIKLRKTEKIIILIFKQGRVYYN